uniref:Uncharacterized protein n=1 Tax=Candidatus Kentrum sp. TUN TaxID=2126343 RepID=A0A450ZPJ0_9GAMM|nr:MAG: hypothetical protein BECKTUN1418D_GA0071000_103516 [Candidatus Kentron sp. TUN]
MIIKYVLAIGIILFLLFGWVTVQHVYRRFAVKNPELGPYGDDTGKCGNCGCGSGAANDSCSSE